MMHDVIPQHNTTYIPVSSRIEKTTVVHIISPVSMQLAHSNGGDSDMTDICHASQGFSSKSHRPNGLQIFKFTQLGCGMPLA